MTRRGRAPRRRHQFTWAEQAAWARQHLPDEHPDLVVMAARCIKYAGQHPTPERIRARLEAQGRSMEQGAHPLPGTLLTADEAIPGPEPRAVAGAAR